jgi:protocatechuate 3,4-dioxygenase, alpha subunit
MSGQSTPSQTVGPFFSIGFSWLDRVDLTAETAVGTRVTISGRVIDGAGQPVPDAVLEIWQADGNGCYEHPEGAGELPGTGRFFGFGRVPVDDQGKFRFITCKPGGPRGTDGAVQAPHLVISLFTRGLLRRLITRIYFPGDPSNESDPVLALVPASRRYTLIARSESANRETLVWDVHLQGDDETVFFDC